MTDKTSYRSVWISDVHLGTKGCSAEELDAFLQSIKTDTLYLVGDIVDIWAIKRGVRHFPQSHLNVVRRILSKSRSGTKVYYIIGNHDELIRSFLDEDTSLGNVVLCNEVIHHTVDGRKLLVVHGDLYDGVVRYHKVLSQIGATLYDFSIVVNRIFNKIRAKLGLGYWSLSSYLKQKVKGASDYITAFEEALSHECKKRELDGVVCGHIHHAEIRDINGVTYYNDGDWVESRTALVEHYDGRIEILSWDQTTKASAATGIEIK
jgi:UDP-2,3-diacylglucosamine pyrophosphatase LpxH